MLTHLAITYLKRSGTRFNVKTITNKQLILNIMLSLVQHVCHCLLTVVCLHFKSSSCPWEVLVRHRKMYANSLHPSLALWIYISCTQCMDQVLLSEEFKIHTDEQFFYLAMFVFDPDYIAFDREFNLRGQCKK